MIIPINETTRISREHWDWQIQTWKPEDKAEHGGHWRAESYHATLLQAAEECMARDYGQADVTGVQQAITAINTAKRDLINAIEAMK